MCCSDCMTGSWPEPETVWPLSNSSSCWERRAMCARLVDCGLSAAAGGFCGWEG